MSGVKTEHAEYTAMKSRWKQCRDAASGEHAVHLAGQEYLPMLKNEQMDAYQQRVAMTPWFNATWRTIAALRGMIFRKPPKVEVPESLADALKNIDLAGTTFDGFAQEVIGESLQVGRVGVLCDYPEVTVRTLADKQALGVRAMLSLYKAEAILNWRTERINGATVLKLVVLEEKTDVPAEDDEFRFKSEARYRVLDLVNGVYRQRVYRAKALYQGASNVDGFVDEQIGDDVYPLMNNQTMDYIPFVFIGVDCVGPRVEEPPLIDLVTTNFKHYGQATSYERGCFFSGLPTLFVSGYTETDKQIYVGGNMANILPDPAARAYFVEVGSQFTALRTNLEDKKREMAVLGARMLEQQRPGVEAAETIARRQNGEESILATMSQTASQGLTRSLQWLADWEGVKAEVSVELNRDFLPVTMGPAEITALMGAWQGGAISKNTLFDNLKQGEVIADDVTFEEEEVRISTSAPNLAPQQQRMATA